MDIKQEVSAVVKTEHKQEVSTVFKTEPKQDGFNVVNNLTYIRGSTVVKTEHK